MAASAGLRAWVMLDGVNGAGTNVSQYHDSFSWPQTVQQLETSVFGTVAKAFIPGLTDGDTVAVSGPFDSPLYSIMTGLKAAQAGGSSTATLVYGPGGSVASSAKISAEVWVASFTTASTVGGRNEWSASLQVTGAVTNGTW